MKNGSNTQINHAKPDELKRAEQATAISKKPTYIYTEEDLGEGLLDFGI